MKIQNYQTIKYNPINFQARNNKPFSLKQLTKDVFQRTIRSSKQTEIISTDISEKEIKELYNEALKFILDHNPVLKELDVPKPKIIFEDLGTSDACYEFLSNTIKIGTKYKDDTYAFAGYSEDDILLDTGIASKEKIDKELLELKIKADKFRVYKLTPEEKKMYLKSILIHELRHWAQEHILAHTKGCEEHLDYRVGLINEIIKVYAEAIDICKETGAHRDTTNKYRNALRQTQKDYSYILSLKPDRILDENYKLKVSFTFFENRHWSLKDHLLPASLRYKHSNDNEYVHNPIEVDAFNYQAEYLMDEKFTGRHKSIRDEVFDAMIISTGARGTYHLDKIEQYGYPPLVVND